MAGFFITFEGGEGAGKSTQIKRLSQKLEEIGYDTVVTREPGGSPGAEAVRHLLLNGAAEVFGPEAEVLLFTTARIDHMQQTILPALERNAIVLCDRFSDSTRAYQGGGDGVSDEYLKSMETIAVGPNKPDLTLILDIPPELGMDRVTKRLASADDKGTDQLINHIDRFEKDDLKVHHKRRDAFLRIAQEEQDRCVVIDASQEPDDVSSVIWSCVKAKMSEKSIKTKRTV